MASKRKHSKRALTQEEIIELLEQSDFSDFSDDNDIDDGYPTGISNTLDRIGDNDEQDIEERTENEPSFIEEKKITKRKKILWKNKKMSQKGPKMEDDGRFIDEDVGEPLDLFFDYFNAEFWEEVALQTNLYSTQQRNLKSVKTTAHEIMKLVGLFIAMGTLKYPQVRMYWSGEQGLPYFIRAMTRDRFFELRNHLHFADNSASRNDNDKLWKIRLFVDCIKQKCISLPRPKHLSIDEQMIPFSGRCQFRQYLPSKPNPLGLKNFILATTEGLVLDFQLYQGKGTVPEADIKDFGLGAGIVKLLTENVSISEENIIYTDRYFTSLKCGEYLLTKGKYLTGTIMNNRINEVSKKMKPDKNMKRGEWDEWVTEDEKMCLLKWKDNKSVTLFSTCIGSEPLGTCSRWSKELKQRADVTQPAIVKAYNMHMGGIDLCDRYLAYYRCAIRTKKWPTRVFTHFVDLVVVNCWIYYKMQQKRQAEIAGEKPKYMSLMQFRMHISQGLLKYEGSPSVRQKGRPRLTKKTSLVNNVLTNPMSNNENSQKRPLENALSLTEELTPKRPREVVPTPLKEIRLDKTSHLPQYMEDKFASKCRYPGCKSRCRIKCSKCNIYLCVLKNNCFFKFHSK